MNQKHLHYHVIPILLVAGFAFITTALIFLTSNYTEKYRTDISSITNSAGRSIVKIKTNRDGLSTLSFIKAATPNLNTTKPEAVALNTAELTAFSLEINQISLQLTQR